MYVVGTPIGNLDDFSLRGQAVLRQVDRILCEDTRETLVLCRYFNIQRPLVSFHAHNAKLRLPQISSWLRQGESLALVSDRGMPAVSDPGQELIAWLYANQMPFSVVPGPSAQVTAFTASGFPHPYVFWGFLPAGGTARRQCLKDMHDIPYTAVLYEAPHHMAKTVADLTEFFGSDYPVVIGRELTKHFEEYWRGTLGLLANTRTAWKGEIVVVLGPSPRQAFSDEPQWNLVIQEVERLVKQGCTIKEATQQIASQHHISRRELYNRVQKSRRD